MQRLRIEAPSSHDGLWIEYDPEGEFVRADEAIDLLNKYNTQSLHLAGAIDLLTRARNAMPVDAEIYERVQRFLTVEVNAVR